MKANAFAVLPMVKDKGTAIDVEILSFVQCKDCIYWQDNNGGYPNENCKWREDETPDPDDFCSAGERKA